MASQADIDASLDAWRRTLMFHGPIGEPRSWAEQPHVAITGVAGSLGSDHIAEALFMAYHHGPAEAGMPDTMRELYDMALASKQGLVLLAQEIKVHHECGSRTFCAASRDPLLNANGEALTLEELDSLNDKDMWDMLVRVSTRNGAAINEEDAYGTNMDGEPEGPPLYETDECDWGAVRWGDIFIIAMNVPG